MKLTFLSVLLLSITQLTRAHPFLIPVLDELNRLPTTIKQVTDETSTHVDEIHAVERSCAVDILNPDNEDMWIAKLTQHGKSTFNNDPNYKVYRNVKDYGCIGDGVADDTACINQAMQQGGRCGGQCGSSTLTPALLYFPSGRYKISSPIIMYYYTQMIGNALNPPTLVASADFQGIGMIDTDPYLQGGDQWYINQNNFFRQIRNFVFDLTGTPAQASTTGVHWQVAQATSLMNLRFIMSTDPMTNHQGIWMENGSGGFMSDLVFEGGKFGMWVGNQQFLSRGLSFFNCRTAIYMNWNWQWTFQKLSIHQCGTGIDMTSAGTSTASGVGSILVLDGEFTDTATGIKLLEHIPTHTDTSGTLLLDNVKATNVGTMVVSEHGNVLLAGGSNKIQSWGSGSLYTGSHGAGILQRGDLPSPPKKSTPLLSADGSSFYTRSRPQYEHYDISSFVSILDGGAIGDGVTDDTAAIQKVIDDNAGCKIVFFPAGTYIISNTVTVPPGSRLTGELWSVLMARGDAFQDKNQPIPMIRVGNQGDQGTVELSDLVFSSYGAQPGVVLLEWNIHNDPAQLQGGIWDSHFRVGGTTGTNLQYEQCPKKMNGTVNEACEGVHTLLRLTQTSSAYLENIWAWTADHDLDDGELQRQVSVYTGRGILIESKEGPVWLYGVQSEHNALYQYQLSHTSNVMMSMIQSETPYWQPVPNAPFPFSGGDNSWNDPTYDHCAKQANAPSGDKCAMAWALRSIESSNVYVYGAGLYNFFYDYDQTCLNTEDCQESLVDLKGNRGLYLYNLNTKGTVNMVTGDNTHVWAKQADNANGFCQTINAFLAEA